MQSDHSTRATKERSCEVIRGMLVGAKVSSVISDTTSAAGADEIDLGTRVPVGDGVGISDLLKMTISQGKTQ